jgi:hypothetical protein
MREHGAELWEKWRGLVSEQIASGQSVAAFFREREVTSSQLFAWKKRLREAERARFVEVQLKPAEPLREVVRGQQAKADRGQALSRSQYHGRAGIRGGSFACIARGVVARSVIGLPSLRTLDAAQVSRIWLAAEPTDMRCGV